MVLAWTTFCTFAAEMTKINALLLLLVLGGHSAWAQYVYYDFADTTVSTNLGFADVDFNNDSITDLRFTLLRDTGSTASISVVYLTPLDSAKVQVAGQKRGSYCYPDRLAVGDSISRSSSLWQGFDAPTFLGYLDYRFGGQHDPFVQWQSPYNDGFIAVRRNVNDTVVNGWVRLAIAADGKSFTLKDAGFQAADDSLMFAGHLWIGAGEPEAPQGYTWRQSAEALVVLRPQGQEPRPFALIDAYGRLIYRGIWRDAEVSLPLLGLPTATYWFVSEAPGDSWHFALRTGIQ
jgi:hypothetical protein